MTEALEIRTPHAEVSDIVRELAPAVDDLSIRLPCAQPITVGDWVRFTVRAADGSAVFEGLGRAEGLEGPAPRRRVLLTRLSFDPRNEIMYERMLLARDAAEHTGTLDLQELDAELIRGPSRVAPPPPPPGAQRRPSTVPPPKPPATRSTAAPPRAPTSGRARQVPLPARKTASKPLPSQQPPLSRPRPADAQAAKPPSIEGQVAAAPDHPRARPSSPPSRREPSPPASPRSERPPAVHPPAEARPRRDPPPRPDPTLHLSIPAPMLAQARMLAPRLPPQLAPPHPDGAEEAVLRAALRLGLAALNALARGEP